VSLKNIKNHQGILLMQLGARNHYAEAIALYEAGILDRFFTDFYWHHNRSFEKILYQLQKILRQKQPAFISKAKGRTTPILPLDKVIDFIPLETVYYLFSGLKKIFPIDEQLNSIYANLFAHLVINNISSELFGVLAFNTSAIGLFRWAKRKGVKCILSQVNYPKDLQAKLYLREDWDWGDWGKRRNLSSGWNLVARREQLEWALADIILVPSEFVADGLMQHNVDSSKIRIVPYGIDNTKYKIDTSNRNDKAETVNILFVGSMILGKGVQYFYKALEQLNSRNVIARIVGPNYLTPKATEKLEQFCELMGSVPRTDMPMIYNWADIMVLPTLSEGSALSVYEALAFGLPVITTPHAGSIIRDRKDGYIVPIRDSRAIAECIEILVSNPELRYQMGQSAANRAREYGSISQYKERIVSAIESIQ